MNPRKNAMQDHRHIMRRDFFSRCCPWKKREPLKIPLSALHNIPDAALMQIVPLLRQGWSVGFCEDGISCRDANGFESVISLGSAGCSAVLLFDGFRTLEHIAAMLEVNLGMAPASGAPVVREAFLTLAMREVYHPRHPPSTLIETSKGNE
jgi:hypothetical protein